MHYGTHRNFVLLLSPWAVRNAWLREACLNLIVGNLGQIGPPSVLERDAQLFERVLPSFKHRQTLRALGTILDVARHQVTLALGGVGGNHDRI